MSAIKIVLDTNCMLRSVSRRSAYAVVLEKLYANSYELYLTNDIMLEYEEKITDIFSAETSDLIVGALALLQNVRKIDAYFQLNLITTDPDDNKFVDCAFAGNVHFLVSDDKHFRILRSIDFPSIHVITLDEFVDILKTS